MDQQAHKGLGINKSTRFIAIQLGHKNQKTIFFIGAGVSSASGLPLGDTLRDLVLSKLYPESPSFDHVKTFRASFYPDQNDITLEMVLQQVRQRLGYDGINDLLKPIFKKIKEPSLSHEILASLAKKGFISLILTTNFDDLLEEALKRKEVNFRVISGRDECVLIDQRVGRRSNNLENTFLDPASGNVEPGDSREVIIWKIHGTLEDPESLSATQEDVCHFPSEKQRALRCLFQDYNVVFVGYSMRDPDIMEVINQVTPKNKKYSFFWVNPSPLSKISKNIQYTANKFEISENYIQMSSDDFFNELNYLLHLRPPSFIWKADEVELLQGGVRGEGDPWNRDCPPYTRIFGASPTQENYVEWEGALIRLRGDLRKPLNIGKDLIKGAALRIEIPPIDGKGIHGRKNGRVILYLVKEEDKKIKISELECVKFGYLNTWWPHDDRYRGIYPEFLIGSDSIKHFDGLQNITLELKIESQVCMDVSRFLLYFF